MISCVVGFARVRCTQEKNLGDPWASHEDVDSSLSFLTHRPTALSSFNGRSKPRLERCFSRR